MWFKDAIFDYYARFDYQLISYFAALIESDTQSNK